MEKAVFNVPSISCSSCAGKIKEAVKSINGVAGVSVDLKSQTVEVEFNPETVKSDEIRRGISSLGYEVIQ